MTRPALEVIGLFSATPPILSSPPADTLACATEVVADVRGVLDAHLTDLAQPLTLHERGPLALARSGLRVRWEGDVPPGERLPYALERMAALCDAGALAIYLPAACKLVGPAEIAAAIASLDGELDWQNLFVHRYLVATETGVWMHTHGLEHFGYPDLECWVLPEAIRDGEQVVDAAIELLMSQGGDALWPGQVLEAVADDRVWASCRVREAQPVAGHAYGIYGALELVVEEVPS